MKDQPTYGGSYKNNLGHYDLLTENGQDLIIVYMSWDICQDEIDWMNQVLRAIQRPQSDPVLPHLYPRGLHRGERSAGLLRRAGAGASGSEESECIRSAERPLSWRIL